MTLSNDFIPLNLISIICKMKMVTEQAQQSAVSIKWDNTVECLAQGLTDNNLSQNGSYKDAAAGFHATARTLSFLS